MITSEQTSLLRGMIRGGERSRLPEEGRPYSRVVWVNLWAAYMDVRFVYPISTYASTCNRRMALTCLWPRLCFFFFLNLSSSGPIRGRESKELHDAALVTHSPCPVLITCACCNQTQTTADVFFITHIPGVRRVAAPYLLAQVPTALPLSEVFTSCSLPSVSPRSV